MRLAALLMVCIASPALAAEQFDLACKGTKVSERGGAAAPHAFRARVDLDKRQWCTDGCERVLDIYDADAERIVFDDALVLNTRMELTNSVTLDRKSGQFQQLRIEARPQTSYARIEATCTTEAFTGFPAIKS